VPLIIKAPCAWCQRFTKFVSTLGFSQCASDHSLFIYHNGNDTTYILLYVEDIILTASSITMAQLGSEFATEDQGPISYFLSNSVTRHSGGIFLSQQKYSEEIIQKVVMTSFKPVFTSWALKQNSVASQVTPITIHLNIEVLQVHCNI
jgi:hypothetical protein